MKKIIVILVVITQNLVAQTIQGNFLEFKNSEIVLEGYSGLTKKEFSKTTTDSIGNFMLLYPINYIGAASLRINKLNDIIVLLNKENYFINCKNLQDLNTLTFTNSIENNYFTEGITINQQAQQKLTGLNYLLPLYKENTNQLQWLQSEIIIQEDQFNQYINNLPKQSYAVYYLKLRKYLSDISRKDLNPREYVNLEDTFISINFADERLWQSGLLGAILKEYYTLLINSTDEGNQVTKLNIATDTWMKGLKNDFSKQEEVATFIIKLLEKNNLQKSAEYIALSLLNQTNCKLDIKHVDLFEQYRKLRIGKKASNIEFGKNNLQARDLMSIKSNYKLVVFGASWCPNCQNDYPSLLGKYKKFKDIYNLEVVYVSIDTDKTKFVDYYKEAPFIIFFDGKGWETQAARDYNIFETPTYILLDKDLKILAKLQSPEELESWLNINGSAIDTIKPY